MRAWCKEAVRNRHGVEPVVAIEARRFRGPVAQILSIEQKQIIVFFYASNQFAHELLRDLAHAAELLKDPSGIDRDLHADPTFRYTSHVFATCSAQV